MILQDKHSLACNLNRLPLSGPDRWGQKPQLLLHLMSTVSSSPAPNFMWLEMHFKQMDTALGHKGAHYCFAGTHLSSKFHLLHSHFSPCLILPYSCYALLTEKSDFYFRRQKRHRCLSWPPVPPPLGTHTALSCCSSKLLLSKCSGTFLGWNAFSLCWISSSPF